MKVRQDVGYCLNRTLLGRKLIVGVKEENSFVSFGREHAGGVMAFIDRYREREIEPASLNASERSICANLDKLGYLDTSEARSRETFNEFAKIGRVFFRISPSRQTRGIGRGAVGTAAFLLLLLAAALFAYVQRGYLPKQIDYVHMRLWEILFTVLVFPPAILLLHELGHCLAAWYEGVRISSISLGWFFIYPIALVQYRGLNLESQSRKVIVMAGGIAMNLLLATLGLALKAYGPAAWHGAVVDIWISANVSAILTNLGLFGMTDGYFIFTSLLGVMNIRLKGYRYINAKLGRKTDKLDASYRVSGLLLLALFLNGVVNAYIQFHYLSGLFDIAGWIAMLVLTLLLVFMTFKFVRRIRLAF